MRRRCTTKRRNWRKKRWSPSKIERCLSDWKRADERAQERQGAHRPESIDLWSNLVRDLLALPDVQQVGPLLHFYSGNVETAVFNVRRATVGFDDFAARLPKIRTRELLMVERPLATRDAPTTLLMFRARAVSNHEGGPCAPTSSRRIRMRWAVTSRYAAMRLTLLSAIEVSFLSVAFSSSRFC